MKIPIEKKVLVGFTMAVTILFIFGIYAYITNRNSITTSRLVSHTNEVLFHIERVLSLSVDMETGKRGYIITGDKNFLEPNIKAVAVIFEHVNKLRNLTLDNPNQQKRIRILRGLVKQSIELSNEAIEGKNKGVFDPSISSVKGRYLMDEVRKVIIEMQQEENTLLTQRAEENEKDIAAFNIAFVCLIAIIVIILIVVFFTIKYHLNALSQSQKLLIGHREEIEDLNKNLEKNLSYLEVANKELEAFTYSVSHDLRAPLRSISGYAKILKEDYAVKIDQEGNHVIDIIVNNASKMGHLIDDLLDFSRYGKKELVKSSIDMSEMVRAIVAEYRSSKPLKQVDVSILELEPTFVDAAMIKQVWINLISNAFKYSRNKEKVFIEIGSSGNETNSVFYIQDNGAGFDMRYVHKLFGVFQRLHNGLEFEGTGVGLAIVQRIILRHGGKVWAEGKVNEGARFYFSIPKN